MIRNALPSVLRALLPLCDLYGETPDHPYSSKSIFSQPFMPKRRSRSAKTQITMRLSFSISRLRANSWRTSVEAPPSLTIDASGVFSSKARLAISPAA